MLVPAVLMFIFASVDVSYALRQNIEAFVESPTDTSARWLMYMRMVDYIVQISIGNAVLVWRPSQCPFQGNTQILARFIVVG
jgi:hypothetical protein